MGFEVAYDPGENIKIVKAIQKNPVIYNAKKFPSIAFRKLQEQAWTNVSAELGVSEGYVKNRWLNIKGCFKRYLKNKARSTTTKMYYLAEYLDFMLPYICVPEVSNGGIECDDEIDAADEFELVVSDGDEDSFFISTNSNDSEDMIIPEESNADWDFFSSLLPDIDRMNEEQKSKFRNSILLAIDTALYGDNI